jgi:putative aldouronate transport system permease protein
VLKKRAFASYNLKRSYALYAMMLLPLLWYVVFCYVPMSGIVIAFKKYSLFRGFIDSPWIGFANFKKFLTDPYFWQVFLNTVRIGFFNLLINFPAPIVLALLLNEAGNRIFKRSIQTIFYLPHFISVVALTNIMILMLSPSMGVVNELIKTLGGKTVNFIIEPNWFVPIYIVTMFWREAGWGTIIYLAAMSGIDPELYNAAEIDGAGRVRKIWNITLPSILPVIGIMFILATPSILGADFETVLLLQQPVTYQTSDVIQTYIYRRGLLNGEFDFATAIGVMFSLIGVIIILATNYLSKKYAEVSVW